MRPKIRAELSAKVDLVYLSYAFTRGIMYKSKKMLILYSQEMGLSCYHAFKLIKISTEVVFRMFLKLLRNWLEFVFFFY